MPAGLADLANLAPAQVFVVLAVFVRVGAAMMTAPGFGDVTLSPIARLAAAFTVSLALAPVLQPLFPAQPASPAAFAGFLFAELFAGVFLGVAAKVFAAAMNVAGQIAAMQIGLAAAQAFDPSQQLQGALVGSFLSIFGVTLIFVLDLHHLFLGAVMQSYSVFGPGVLMPAGDAAATMLATLSEAFALGLRLAAPFIVYGVAFYAGAGVLARLMPQVQVFFIMMPGQVLGGIFILMLTSGLLASLYIRRFEAFVAQFAG